MSVSSTVDRLRGAGQGVAAFLKGSDPLSSYLRYDTNDYSLDPRYAGRRVEVKAAQRQIVATALDTGEVVAQHRRCFAKQLTFTDQAHQAALDRLRGERRRGKAPEVERRALDRYDALIPA